MNLLFAHVSSIPHTHGVTSGGGLALVGAIVALMLVTAAVFRFARGVTHG